MSLIETPAIETPARLAAIQDRYDVLLCDVWGVVHNGRALFPGVADALRGFRAKGGAVILLTNVPKPRAPIPGQLDRIGLPRDCYDVVVTSGDAIREELRARAPGPYFRIGPDDDNALWDGLDLQQTRRIEDAAFIAISGLNDPFNEHPDDYRATLSIAQARGLTMVCANPDRVVRVGARLMWCAGAVAEVYESIGGDVVMAGKPHAPIYRLAFEEAHALRPDVRRERVLCIGDGVITDVLGANAQGLDCLFIAAGIHGDGLMRDGALDAEKVAAALAEHAAHARYAMPALI